MFGSERVRKWILRWLGAARGALFSAVALGRACGQGPQDLGGGDGWRRLGPQRGRLQPSAPRLHPARPERRGVPGHPAQLRHPAPGTVLCRGAAAGGEGSKAAKGWAGGGGAHAGRFAPALQLAPWCQCVGLTLLLLLRRGFLGVHEAVWRFQVLQQCARPQPGH